MNAKMVVRNTTKKEKIWGLFDIVDIRYLRMSSVF
jgi:hypothetical protein